MKKPFEWHFFWNVVWNYYHQNPKIDTQTWYVNEHFLLKVAWYVRIERSRKWLLNILYNNETFWMVGWNHCFHSTYLESKFRISSEGNRFNSFKFDYNYLKVFFLIKNYSMSKWSFRCKKKFSNNCFSIFPFEIFIGVKFFCIMKAFKSFCFTNWSVFVCCVAEFQFWSWEEPKEDSTNSVIVFFLSSNISDKASLF